MLLALSLYPLSIHHDHDFSFALQALKTLQLRAFSECGNVLRNTARNSAFNEMMDRGSWWINSPASLLLKWDTVPQRVPNRSESQLPIATPICLFSFLPYLTSSLSYWCFLGPSPK